MAAPSQPSSSRAFSIESLRVHAGIMLVLRGELDLATVIIVEAELARAEQDHKLIALDLRDLDFIDSTGLHMLIQANERVREAGGRLLLVQGSRQVRRLFQLTQLGEHLEVVDEPPSPQE